MNDAEDLVQDTLLRAVAIRSRPKSSWRTWLFAIATYVQRERSATQEPLGLVEGMVVTDLVGQVVTTLTSPQTTRIAGTPLRLADSGYVTSHRVKYTHHVDGNCHFSQDGKVVTTVRNVARPLTATAGHVFTLYVQGLSHYSEPKAKDDAEMFDLGHAAAPGSLRLVGRWLQHAMPLDVQNPVGMDLPPVHKGVGIACCPAAGSPFDGFVLLIEAFEMPVLDPNPAFILAFVGGFGPDMLDQAKESSFLALSYPQTDPAYMPSMDLVAKAASES